MNERFDVMVRQRIVTDYARWKRHFLIPRFHYVSPYAWRLRYLVRIKTASARRSKNIEIEE